MDYTYTPIGAGNAKNLRLDYVTYPNGRVVKYGYGAAGGMDEKLSRITAITNSAASTTYAQYTYLGAGTVVKVTHPGVTTGGLELTYLKTSGSDPYAAFDRFGRIVDQKWQNTAANIKDRYKYGYDASGNRTYKENVGPSGKDEFYTYDDLDRLKSYDRGDLNAGKTAIDNKVRNEAWGLTQTGNWKDYQIDANGNGSYGDAGDLDQDRTHNDVNEITDLSGTANDPAYDSAGNMTQDEDKKYEFDGWNRLVKVRNRGDDSLIATYSYDGKNRRIRKVVEDTPDVTYDYYYNTSWQILEVRKNETSDADPLKQYVWGIRYIDAPVVRFRDTNQDQTVDDTLYYCNDANMNVTCLVDSVSGNPVERYVYDPYGKLTVLDPDWSADADNKSDYDNQILFCGYRHDPESDNYECRNRYLTTKYGWITRDPKDADKVSGGYHDGMNSYEYVRSNPPRHTDPYGLWIRVKENFTYHSFGGFVTVGLDTDTWRAEKGDTLKGLASKAEYGGNSQNWRCLWPTKDTEDHGYPNTIKACDKYDASNLAIMGGPKVYINMDSANRVYKHDRPQAHTATTGTAVYDYIKQQSGEGASPIHYFEINGHSWNWPGMSAGGKTNKKIKKKGGTRDDFYPGRYLPNQPTPTFARAQQQKGPRRCWFTRSANGYSFACGGYSFGKAFAGSFLRRGARINTSPEDVKIYMRWKTFDRNDWGFGKSDDDIDYYSNIDEFLKSTGWATVRGKL